jgi:hypothetical protein
VRPDAERTHLIRHSRKALRLGESAPVCLGCGCVSIEALVGVPFLLLPAWAQRRTIERHHLAGRAVDPEWTVPLCHTCHAVASDRQHDLPSEVRRPGTERERQAARLYGVADALRIAEEGLRSARTVVEQAAESLLSISAHEEDPP